MKQLLISYLVITSIFASASGTEFQVNTRPAYDQTYADIATDANGNFVVIWTSYYSSGNKSNEIRGRRFAADGSPINANEFEINTIEAGNQKEPAVAMDSSGNFVVVWQGPQAIEDANEDIFAQRFEPNGQPIGSEFRVNTNTFSRQLHPEIAMNNTGHFVIVWESETLGGIPSEAWSICSQIYDSNGQPIGTEFGVNLLLQSRYPDVAMDGYGNFTVVWMQDDDQHSHNVIMARRYDAAGQAKTDPCELSTGKFYTIAHPSIAMDGTGHFVVCWEGHPDSDDEKDIHARRYKFDGSALSQQFTVNTTTAAAQQYPEVAMNNRREFVIIWDSETSPGSSKHDVFSQRYDELWTPIGDEFRVNTYMADDQKYPDIAMREDGQFVAVWQSKGQDSSGYGIFGEFGPMVGSADFTGDGFVNFRDYCVLAEEWLKVENPLRADLVDDNKIDRCDLNAFCDQWLSSCYECDDVDIYNDGRIDFKDYSLLTGSWLNQGPSDADITGDGTVDLADLKALTLHWAKTCEQ